MNLILLQIKFRPMAGEFGGMAREGGGSQLIIPMEKYWLDHNAYLGEMTIEGLLIKYFL